MKLRARRHRTLVQQRHAPAALVLRRGVSLRMIFFRPSALRSRRLRGFITYEPVFPDEDFPPLARPRAAIIPR